MKAHGVAGFLVALIAAASAHAEVAASALQQTEFVFIARVTKVEGIVFPEVSADVRLAEAVVEEVISKPESVVLGPKEKVFVAFRDPVPETGARLRLYAAALSYGTAIAMREVARETAPPLAMGMADVSETRNEARDELREAQLDQAVDAADAVVIGRVVAIERLPWQNRITEDDPLLTDALVEVQSWIKGGDTLQVVVQFPASGDLQWRDVPKLEPGMERTFLLHQGAAPSATSTAPNLKRFRIMSINDVHPASEAETVKRLAEKTDGEM